MESPNPFNITKASDLTDEQIGQFWVGVTEKRSLDNLVKPKSSMPMLILGGKGSGKTHLMRFLSFTLQKLRHGVLLEEGLNKDKYLGIYFRCNGLNSNRFEGKNQSPETWQSVFAYYYELWIAQLVIQNIIDCKKSIPSLLHNENLLCNRIVNLFDKWNGISKPQNLEDILIECEALQKNIDLAVNNAALTGKIEGFSINVTPGKLIYGIPKLLCKHSNTLSKIQFLYLVDEFENLSECQQKYVNTLLREKEIPSSFRIGARLYGIKTQNTLSDNEKNKKGSEFEIFWIDEYFRNTISNYPKFVRQLVLKRINQTGMILGNDSSDRIDDYFEEFKEEETLSIVKGKYLNNNRPYIEKLRGELKSAKISGFEEIVNNLIHESDLILERAGILAFYRVWAKYSNNNLIDKSKEIQKDRILYKKDYKSSKIFRPIVEKFRKDIRDQILIECDIPIPYVGLDTFIDMSNGIPRVLLTILKNIYQWSIFNGEDPFRKGKISIESQLKGVNESSEWFFEDAEISGIEGKTVRDSIIRLARFLRIIRFASAPPNVRFVLSA